MDVSTRTAASGDVVGISENSSSSAVPVDVHPSFKRVFLNESNVPFVQQSVLDLKIHQKKKKKIRIFISNYLVDNYIGIWGAGIFMWTGCRGRETSRVDPGCPEASWLCLVSSTIDPVPSVRAIFLFFPLSVVATGFPPYPPPPPSISSSRRENPARGGNELKRAATVDIFCPLPSSRLCVCPPIKRSEQKARTGAKCLLSFPKRTRTTIHNRSILSCLGGRALLLLVWSEIIQWDQPRKKSRPPRDPASTSSAVYIWLDRCSRQPVSLSVFRLDFLVCRVNLVRHRLSNLYKLFCQWRPDYH